MRSNRVTRVQQGNRNTCRCGRPVRAGHQRGFASLGLPATMCVHRIGG